MLVRLLGNAMKFGSVASTESTSGQDEISPPQRVRAKSNQSNVSSSSDSSPQSRTLGGTNNHSSTSSSISHNSSPSSSPKQEDDDAYLAQSGSSTTLNDMMVDGIDYLLLNHSPTPPKTSTTCSVTNVHPSIFQQPLQQQNVVSLLSATPSSTVMDVGSKQGLSNTPVDAHRKHLPSGSLIRPYHHYKVFYCGDNRYNLLHDIAVEQFVMSRSTRMYKIGKSAPIDRLNISSSNVTKLRSNSEHHNNNYNNNSSSNNIQQQESQDDNFLKIPQISLSLNDNDSVLKSTLPSNTPLCEDFNDIQQANSFSVSSSFINTADVRVPSLGQQLYQMNSSQTQQDFETQMNHNKLYNSNDELSELTKPAISTTQTVSPNVPYFRSSVNFNYLSPFGTSVPTNTSNNNLQKNPFGSTTTTTTNSSSSSSSNRSQNSFFGSATSFAEGIETTVIHPIDIHRFLSSSSSVTAATNSPITTKTSPSNVFANNFAYITEEIVFVAAGFDSTFFLSQSGRIWSCGENSCQQLGHQGNDLNEIRDAQFLNIKEIISRGEHTLFLSHDNISLYSCGSNRFGQCGIGSSAQEVQLLTPLNSKIGPIKQVVCGYDHTVVLTGDHQVYMCGDNTDFQLGNTFPQSVNVLTKLDTSKFTKSRIVKVQAGDYHTILLTASGEVFVTGSNNYGEIGSGGAREFFTLQSEVVKKFGAIICDIFTNSLTSYMRDTNGNFYVMGDNQYGHAAVGYAMDVIPPSRSAILSDPDVLDIYVGKCHLVYTKRSKKSPQEVEVYSIGLNEFNQLGIESDGTDDHHTVPVRLLDLETIYQYQRKRWRTKRMNIVCSTYATIVYFTQRNEQEVSELFKLLMLRLVLPDKWFKAVEGKKLEMGFDVDIESEEIWKFTDISIVTFDDDYTFKN